MMPKKDYNEFRWGRAIYYLIMLVIVGFILTGFVSAIFGVDFESLSGNVALIPIEGVILATEDSESFLQDIASSTDIIELIEKADRNPNIRAIVFEINSPGGSAVGSQEIANAIKKTNKTSVAWIRETGTSGAYWVASATDHIVASEVSTTGSIGVIASYLEFGGFLQEHNITYRRLISGKYKDMGTPLRELSEEEEKILQSYLDSIRDYFIEEVAENRGMRKYEVERLATGLFYLGEEAKRNGLVDQLGSKDEVIEYIQKKENIKVDLVKYKKEKTLLDIFGNLMKGQSFFVGLGIGKAFTSTPYPRLEIFA